MRAIRKTYNKDICSYYMGVFRGPIGTEIAGGVGISRIDRGV